MTKRKPSKARKPRTQVRGALTTIGGLLIASAVLRASVGAGEAFAREPGDLTTPNAPHTSALPTAKGTNTTTDGETSPTVVQIAEPDIMPLIEELNKREARVRQREEDVDVRVQALAVAEQEIERKLQELQATEEKLRGTLALARTAAEDDITRLTDVYANMKPKQAAALFEEMDPDFAAGFLARMRPDAAAAIMAGLTPGAAYTISVVLAGRNAEVPKE